LAVQSPALPATEFKQKHCWIWSPAGFAKPGDCKRLGVIDDYYLQIDQAVQGADCVVIATPVASMKAFSHCLSHFGQNKRFIPM